MGNPPQGRARRTALRLSPLRNAIRHYDWGSRSALAALQGRTHPTPLPEAELWMGAHPLAPSRVLVEGSWRPLDRVIADAPAPLLGEAAFARCGARLPFLLKILAIERPLSLQVHPDAERARAGYEAEQRAGVASDAPGRRYRDPYGKAELLCALTRVDVLQGFRDPPAIAADLERLGWVELATGGGGLRGEGGLRRLRAWLRALFALPAGSSRSRLEAAHAGAVRLGASAGRFAWLERLLAAYPEDVASLAPLFLHHVELAPGEALFVPPGTPHCYLRGVAVEIQESSDNAVRAGLTNKAVDVEECFRLLDFGMAPPGILRPGAAQGGEFEYSAPASFHLSRLTPGPETPLQCAVRGPEIWLCTDGGGRLCEPGAPGEVELGPGQALFIAAPVERVVWRGEALLFRARIGG